MILYLADNRSRPNWGCRATSMALGALLQQVGPISDIINGVETSASTMTPLRSGIALPKGVRRFFRGTRRISWSVFYALDSFLDLSHDFLEVDTQRSVESFLRLKGRFPVLEGIYQKFVRCEMLVINGEGTYIFTDRPRRDTLYYNFAIALAKKMGKKACVVNAMFSDEPEFGKNKKLYDETVRVLRQTDLITTRDPESYDYLMPDLEGHNVKYVPDALFTWSAHMAEWKEHMRGGVEAFESFGYETHKRVPDVDLSKPYIAVSGSSWAARDQDRAYNTYKGLISELQKLGLPLLIVPTCGGDVFLNRLAEDLSLPSVPVGIPIRIGAAILGNAEVFVSGRFHPAVMASCGGTPCVFLSSNSHKTRSLQNVLEYDNVVEHHAMPDAAASALIRQQCEDYLAVSRRERIAEVTRRLGQRSSTVVDLLSQMRDAR
ncbi:MAG: polysaccharide pyruvyl transferase family protein [Verrucomicrobiota bacterium JB022]|nr:polysaccharide pyruvyl transferase family protein [Verrucomicrobiota bacterium JB022]